MIWGMDPPFSNHSRISIAQTLKLEQQQQHKTTKVSRPKPQEEGVKRPAPETHEKPRRSENRPKKPRIAPPAEPLPTPEVPTTLVREIPSEKGGAVKLKIKCSGTNVVREVFLFLSLSVEISKLIF
jgi:hypothetical protein